MGIISCPLFTKTLLLIGQFLAAGDHILFAIICIFAGWEVSYRRTTAQPEAKLVGFQTKALASFKDADLQFSAYGNLN